MNTTKKYLLAIFSIVLLIACDNEAFFELERPNQFPWVNVNELELGVREPYYLQNREPWTHAFGTMALKNFTESDIALFLPPIRRSQCLRGILQPGIQQGGTRLRDGRDVRETVRDGNRL